MKRFKVLMHHHAFVDEMLLDKGIYEASNNPSLHPEYFTMEDLKALFEHYYYITNTHLSKHVFDNLEMCVLKTVELKIVD